MSDYSDFSANFREEELRSMIAADSAVDGGTHPLIVTAVAALSMALCPTTNCTKEC